MTKEPEIDVSGISRDIDNAAKLLQMNHIPSRKEMICAIAYLKNVLEEIEKELVRTA